MSPEDIAIYMNGGKPLGLQPYASPKMAEAIGALPPAAPPPPPAMEMTPPPVEAPALAQAPPPAQAYAPGPPAPPALSSLGDELSVPLAQLFAGPGPFARTPSGAGTAKQPLPSDTFAAGGAPKLIRGGRRNTVSRTEDAQLGIIKDKARIENDEIDALRAAQERTYVDTMLHQAEKQAISEESTRKQEEILNDYRAKLDDYASKGVDPGRIFRNETAGQRLMGGLAASLGGWLQVATGQENQYFKMMEKEIDRDVTAQENDIARRKNAAEGTRSMYQEYRQMGMDKSAARDALYNTGLELTKLQLQQKMATVKSDEVKNKYMDMINQIQNKQSNLEIRQDAAIAGAAQAYADKKFKQGVELAKVSVDAKKAEKEGADTSLKSIGYDPERLHYLGNGQALLFKDKNTAKEVSPEIAKMSQLTGTIDQTLSLMNKPGASLSPQQRAQVQQGAVIIQSFIRSNVTKAGAALSDKEAKDLNVLANSDPNQIIPVLTNNKELMGSLKKFMGTSIDALVQNSGGAVRVPVTLQDGQFVPDKSRAAPVEPGKSYQGTGQLPKGFRE